MRVWLLQTGEILPLEAGDRRMRTALLADALAARGHDVTWWCSAFDHMGKRMVLADDAIVPLSGTVRLRALRGTGYRNNVSLARYVDHRIVAAKFARRAAQAPRPHVIVAAMPDLYLAYEAARFAQQAGVPLIVDGRAKPNDHRRFHRYVWAILPAECPGPRRQTPEPRSGMARSHPLRHRRRRRLRGRGATRGAG